MTNTNLSFTISSKTQLNKKFIKLTISYKNHFKQEMDIKKEKKTFGKIFAIELQLFPEAAPSQLQEKKMSPTPYLKLSPFRMKKLPTSTWIKSPMESICIFCYLHLVIINKTIHIFSQRALSSTKCDKIAQKTRKLAINVCQWNNYYTTWTNHKNDTRILRVKKWKY